MSVKPRSVTTKFALRRWLNQALNLLYPDGSRTCLLCHRPLPDEDFMRESSFQNAFQGSFDGDNESWADAIQGVCPFCLQDAVTLYHQESSVRILRVPVQTRVTGAGEDGGAAPGAQTAAKAPTAPTASPIQFHTLPVMASAVYDGLIRTAIRQWKYDGTLEFTRWFAQWMGTTYATMQQKGEFPVTRRSADNSRTSSRLSSLLMANVTADLGTDPADLAVGGAARNAIQFLPPDILVPVPSSIDRFQKRGYDHVLLLTQALSVRLGIPLNPALVRHPKPDDQGFTQSQTAKSARERLQGLQGAYSALPDAKLTGRRVLLIDDIVTTGATLFTCAQALYQVGASQVMALVIADVK